MSMSIRVTRRWAQDVPACRYGLPGTSGASLTKPHVNRRSEEDAWVSEYSDLRCRSKLFTAFNRIVRLAALRRSAWLPPALQRKWRRSLGTRFRTKISTGEQMADDLGRRRTPGRNLEWSN